MNRDIELLNHIYQESQMGVDTIKHIQSKVNNEDLEKHLNIQLKEYRDINKNAMNMMNEAGYQEKDLNSFSKISANLNIDMKTIMDDSASHIAEMMIQGSTMGIVEATKKMDEYADVSPKALNLQKKLLKTEQSNVEELKQFL